jgi:hypothetical protein
MKSSPPLKKSSSASKSKRPGLGCSILAGVFLVGLIIAGVGVGLGLSNVLANSQAAPAPSELDDKTSPEILAARRENEQAQLNSYGWIDKEAGLVRIPINQAIALIAESGLPIGKEETTQAPPEEAPPVATPAPEVDSDPSGMETPIAEEPATATPEPGSAGESSDEEPPPPEPSPTTLPEPTVNLAEVSFKTHVLPIFEQHCLQCHGGEQPEGGIRTEEGLSLKSYEDIMLGSLNGSVIEPGDVEGSYLIEQVTTGRMPKEGDRLTPAEIEIITAWVEAGAPDN